MPAKKKIEEAVQTVEKEVKKTGAAAKRTARKVADKAAANEIEAKKTAAKTRRSAKSAAEKAKVAVEDVKEAAEAVEIEAKKTTRKTARKVKEAVEAAEAKVEKKAAKAKAAKVKIIVQSPMGGNITAEEIAAKIPADADSVFVRVDQNKLWWTKGEETGSVDIWD